MSQQTIFAQDKSYQGFSNMVYLTLEQEYGYITDIRRTKSQN